MDENSGVWAVHGLDQSNFRRAGAGFAEEVVKIFFDEGEYRKAGRIFVGEVAEHAGHVTFFGRP